jgi:hypothetical protein
MPSADPGSQTPADLDALFHSDQGLIASPRLREPPAPHRVAPKRQAAAAPQLRRFAERRMMGA